MTKQRYEKRMNFNINLPSNRCFKTEEVIVDRKEDCYEALSINDIVYRLNLLDNLEQENQKLDEKVCCLTMDLVTTKSYKQLEKELERFKKENEQLKQSNRSTLREFEKGVQKVQKLAKENEQLKEVNVWLWGEIKKISPPKEIPIDKGDVE